MNQPGEDRLNLVSSRNAVFNAKTGYSTYYNGVFEHKGSTLSADSSIMYEDELKQQFFEAFGNVVITQPSGTVIYADKLHYDATPQVATLTNNVRMVDANSVLTTNFLVYKMRSKIGTYTGGGRIISKGDTITSKNAYYFETTQDAYFRNKVVVRTPNVKIYTDTMRYNSAQRMTYFFGPTNIKGNKNENLYTEKGNYNTATGVANFSKNNLYTEGSRFLKGDSLHYDRNSGYGKAFRNVVFVDTSDKFYAHGGYGLYNQSDESITMTEKPLITMVVNNDTTKTAPADSTAVINEGDSKKKNRRKIDKKAAATEEVDTEQENLTLQDDSTFVEPPEKQVPKVDSVYMTADTLFSKMILLKDYKALDFKLDRSGGELDVEEDVDYGDDETDIGEETEGKVLGLPDSLGVDSIGLDSVGKKVLEKDVTARVQKPAEIKKPTIKEASKAVILQKNGTTEIAKTLQQDSIIRQRAVVPREAEADSLINKALQVAQETDTVFKDTSNTAYLDTARTRIVKAYYNVRMFKSDLQAVADSVYYGMADSMFRFMGRPMIWSDGSQISSDTIFMQIKQQKMDNALLVNNAFMVNAVLDSIKYNQLKGRKITAFFANNAMDRLYVDGNAENLVFSANDKTNKITEMFHDRGARIKIKMEGKKIIDYTTIRKVDQKVYPFRLVTAENETLPGFIWRPEDRPKSKQDMMDRKRELPKGGAANDGEESSKAPDQEQGEQDGNNALSEPTGPNEAKPSTDVKPGAAAAKPAAIVPEKAAAPKR
ncbi:hypothetical protein GCM10017764_06810 [Sphingobacterium griseoflavum]|uniref:Organic solvent tolerance-like N-terminal domain-containing protein n=2 Tax=Sphingobacterium griseoflavum TaxID=1474952 RepID=A0ABQ3HWG7_9SPHI|nr:hypothetical protein GCM10017764_06810 [Sphingobacterium griseoflavum]